MSTFYPETELILNADGSVYHLNLLASDIAGTIITVGDPDRVEMVSSFFDRIEIKKRKREFVTHTGIYKGKRLTVLSSGIGPDNVEIVFHELDALVNIDLKARKPKDKLSALNIVRIGTAGSLQAEIAPDAFVCSQYGLGFDGLLNFYETVNTAEEKKMLDDFISFYGEKPGLARPYFYAASPKLVEALSKDMYKGITVTCPGFYAPQGRILRYKLAYPGIVDALPKFRTGETRINNFEMETSAMLGLGKLLGHNVCAVNAIVANRITKEHTKDYEATMKKLILLVLDRMSALAD